MVPKSPRESETITRSWDRKTKALRPAPPAAFLRVIWRRGGASAVRSHGSCFQTSAKLPRRSSKPPTCDKHEYTKFSTASLTNGSRGNAWSKRSAAILKRCVRNLNWKGPYSGISGVQCFVYCREFWIGHCDGNAFISLLLAIYKLYRCFYFKI